MKSLLSVFFSICLWINFSSAQWTQINTGLGSLKITGVARVGTTIYAGTSDKGVFSSIDNGNSWTVYSGNSTLPSLTINGLEGDINGLGMFIYTQNGMALLQPPLALYVPPFNQTLSNKDVFLYRQYTTPTSRRIIGTKNAGLFFTEDNATYVWTEGSGLPAGASKNIRGFISQDITVLAILGTENGAFQSTERGNTWTAANTGLSGNALKINNMYSVFALTSNGLYFTSPTVFTGWTTAITTGDFRACASDLISGKYYFFGDHVGNSVDLNTSQIANIPLGGISGGIITSALLYNNYVFVGTETGGIFKAAIAGLVTGVHERNELPNELTLSQNYPNPFNPTTTISFSLPSKSYVSLKIFDALGREVALLVSEEMSTGTYSRQWNAKSLPSGVYFYRLQSGSFTDTKKLVLLR